MKQKLLHVLPECFVDTNLIEYLLNSGVNHQHCCSKVVGTMKEKYGDSFAIGIIDKDKVEMGYLGECNVLANSEHLTLYRHKSRHHYIITVAPAIDGFVLDCAKNQDVNPGEYGLPSELKAFTKVTKQVTSNADGRFKSLFAAIDQNPEIIALKTVLSYLNAAKYEADVEMVKSFFAESKSLEEVTI